MCENLTDRIYKEIQKTGYPTELIVNKKFEKKQWLCYENEYYIDQDENKGREIDLKAQTNISCADPCICVWSMLSIEIKKSDKPWVIFTSDKKLTDTGGYGLLHHTQNINCEVLSYDDIMLKHPSTLYNRLGRNEFIPFTKDNPQIFRALLSSTKSCIESHRAAADHKLASREASYVGVFYSPLIIVDSRLFEAYLDDNNEININEANHIVYSFNYASPNYASDQYLVDIVTIFGLDTYLDQQRLWISSMLNAIEAKV